MQVWYLDARTLATRRPSNSDPGFDVSDVMASVCIFGILDLASS